MKSCYLNIFVCLSFQNISENDLKTFGAKSIGIMLHDNKFIKELNIAGSLIILT